MDRDDLTAVLITLSLSVLMGFIAMEYRVLSLFIPGLLASLGFYFLVTRNGIPNPDKMVPLYLFALAVQLLHFLEEYQGEFYIEAPELFNLKPLTTELFVQFNILAYFLFILGAIAWLKKIKFGMVIPLFFILFGVMGNAIGHIALALFVKGYFPGLYTALAYVVIGPLMIGKLLLNPRSIP